MDAVLLVVLAFACSTVRGDAPDCSCADWCHYDWSTNCDPESDETYSHCCACSGCTPIDPNSTTPRYDMDEAAEPTCACADWCSSLPGLEVNCGKQGLLCCGCSGCPNPGKVPKWWDISNSYGDRSCLVWGWRRQKRGPFGKERVEYSSFCRVERPVCHGHDCNPFVAEKADDNM